MNQTWQVTPAESGRRIDAVLVERAGHSRSFWQQQLRQGRVVVDRKPVKPNHRLEIAERISIASPAKPPQLPPAPELPIIYQDKDILVINKPAGLLTHRRTLEQVAPSVADALRSKVKDSDPLRPGIVHRLDRETSGVLIVARNPATKDYLVEQFAQRKVKKTYLALVRGLVKPPEAIVQLPIGRASSPHRRRVTSAGKLATTHYRLIDQYPSCSLVEAQPETGRTHQLRVHFTALGHPIVGDTVYGSRRRISGLGRQFLHASVLELTGPDGCHLRFASPLPSDLSSFLSTLKKSGSSRQH